MKLPSKTFILGEYVVLDGGPGLILTTPPYFEVQIQATKDPEILHTHAFHPQSPAGIWVQQHPDFFKHHHIDFFDPHHGKGGFGASSAQFIGVYDAIHPIQKEVSALKNLLNAYWATYPTATKPLPSGADLVAQIFGNVVYWHRAQQQLSSDYWPFKDLDYCLIHTGHKISTHENLMHLPSSAALTQMAHVTEEGAEAFRLHNTPRFIEAIQHYARWMQQEKCVIPTTQTLIELLYESKLIAAAKGCGALGADVILVLADPEKMPHLLRWLNHRNITVTYHIPLRDKF